ncbi:MAG TPA: 30S ribosomal protein S5 [Anaerolineae bacterium]|nr:30S ribosomal protein S5 [Anaerolineae bacterium]HQH37560.1 30S ribosomal protein S5 [Anaerolineae bacterium]
MEESRQDRRPVVKDEQEELDERVVDITRVAKVVKGGRTFHFRVVAVVGDNKGQVGLGIGKARTVPDAIEKATERARRAMHTIPLEGTTIPHDVVGRCGGAKVLLRPANKGTGVIAGGGVRAVLEAAGIHDILTKSQGSATAVNVVQATMQALDQLRWVEELAKERGKPVAEVMPFWRRREA